MTPEDYTRSRPLATIEHNGRKFQIVRRRFDGKPRRGYLTLVYDGVDMMGPDNSPRVDDPSDVIQVQDCYKRTLARLFPANEEGRRNMDDGIVHCINKHKQAVRERGTTA